MNAQQTGGLAPADARTLMRLQNCLTKAQETLPDVPIMHLATLLAIAGNEGTTLGELCAQLGIAQSTGSRMIIALTAKQVRKGQGGFDLARTFEDPQDSRRKLIWLTPKGRTLVGKLLATITGGS